MMEGSTEGGATPPSVDFGPTSTLNWRLHGDGGRIGVATDLDSHQLGVAQPSDHHLPIATPASAANTTPESAANVAKVCIVTTMATHGLSTHNEGRSRKPIRHPSRSGGTNRTPAATSLHALAAMFQPGFRQGVGSLNVPDGKGVSNRPADPFGHQSSLAVDLAV